MSAQLNLPVFPKLPLLPGFVIQKPKEDNHLPHCFLCLDGTGLVVDKNASDKDWFLNSNRILSFKAYPCGNSDDTEIEQNRLVKILYFMEDETIQVIEIRKDHSGKPIKVCVVKRQRIQNDSSDDEEYLTYSDFNVQKQVTILGQTYTITDCDDYTRLFLNKNGIKVPESIKAPNELEHWTNENAWEPKKLVKRQNDDTKHEQFLNYDHLRLKFDAYWDDRESPFGEIHNLIVCYFLSDHTIQIIEFPRGERPVVFYKRLRLPKKIEDVFSLHQKSNPLVLGARLLDKCVPDRSDLAKTIDPDYYTDADLMIGQVLNVFGRKVVLTDCDDYTKDYYRKKYGVETFTPIETPKDPRWEPIDTEKQLPPYNGWGSIEDSESSCHSVVELKTPKSNKKNFLQQNNAKLRFKAQLLAKTEDDSDREFVITFYLDDDTISVYEVGNKHTRSSGELFKRAKFYLPHQCVFTSHRPNSYTSQMMYIGANIELNSYIFHLTDADEFTLNFLESHASEYPKANIISIIEKIKGAFQSFEGYKNFLCKYLGDDFFITKDTKPESMKLCYNTTAMALKELLGSDITEHEIVTFLRYFNVDKSTKKTKAINRATIRAMVHKALANRLWEEIETLKSHIHASDPLKESCFIQKEKLNSIIKGCRFPIKGLLLNHMLLVLNKDANGNIDINDFLNFIDRKNEKILPIEPMVPYEDDGKKSFDSSAKPQLVDWGAFISELDLDAKFQHKLD